MNQHPVAYLDAARWIVVEESDVDVPANPCDVDFRKTVRLVNDFKHLAGDGQTHALMTPLQSSTAKLPPMEGARKPALFGRI